MGVTTFVLLIRHGENDYVTTHRLAGRTPGVHLNDKGRQQAEGLVEHLTRQPIDVVYSSPLDRCLETAAPLAAAREREVVMDLGVVEVDYGQWQGADLRELGKLPEWSQVQHYPSMFRFPDGETLREVQGRAVEAIERLRHRHPNQVVAIFSHGDIVRTALAHYLGVPLDLFQRIAIAPASVSILGFFDDRPMVLGVNYVAELPVFEIKQPEAGAAAGTTVEAAAGATDEVQADGAPSTAQPAAAPDSGGNGASAT